MDNDRLQLLLHLYFDEGLDQETKQELEELLLASPRARELFWQRAELNSLLRQWGQESWGRESVSLDRSAAADQSIATAGHRWHWVTAASLLLVASLSFWIYSNLRPTPDAAPLAENIAPTPQQSSNARAENPEENPAESPAWVAVVRKAVNVQWQDRESALNAGEAMSPRRIRFESGLVEIQTNRGAILAVEGPADLEIVSGMEVFCRTGRLRVDVPPPAIGFLVNTPQINVVDRGTSFAMDVQDDATTEVHVLEGMVELVSQSPSIPNRELLEGQSVGVTGDVYRDITPDLTTFPSADQVRSRTRSATTKLRQSWSRRRDVIASDPSCFVYYDFEPSQNGDTMLSNKAINAAPYTDGTIVGGEWAEGRWPGKKALEFSSVFDRILFSAPGEHKTLTCLASVRLDGMSSELTPLLMPCDSNEGNFRWQIASMKNDGNRGQLRVRRRASMGWDSDGEFVSKPSLRLEQLGTWIQLAIVWDGDGFTCSQYVDGTLVAKDMMHPNARTNDVILRTGQMEIGNRTPTDDDPAWSSQHFRGRIDEFAMFDRALSADEIVAYHDLKKITWSNGGRDRHWDNPANWSERIEPAIHDAVYIDRSGEHAAIYSQGTSPNLNEIRVGSTRGRTGELQITGGTLTAIKYADANSRIGVAGGHGKVIQQDGDVTLNTLQIALDDGSQGSYFLHGGNLLIKRGIDRTIGSIDIGAIGGNGSLDVLGGSLTTRIGVSLGRQDGKGQFSVHGSQPTKIAIGSHLSGKGFWVQHSGGTLRALIDDQGLTPIVIDDIDNDAPVQGSNAGRRSVTFEKGALLEVDFLENPRAGSWDVMTWQGDMIDHGLRFSDQVDPSVWSFEFVDTDASGSPDTLRVTATSTNETVD
tara:strand:- start:28927 stop:31539 length:2613 start_codon:yes stop_codon:yes gene_type:complete